MVLFILPVVFTAKAADHPEVDIQATDLGTSKITIDGNETEWEDILDHDFTLSSPVNPTDSYTVPAELKVAYDANYVYFFVVIIEKFQGYNLTKAAETDSFVHDQMWGLGLAFSINGSDSSRHMGATNENDPTSVGYADIMHWEAEVPMGVATSSAGFEDMWATAWADKEVDAAGNAWTGAWMHSNPTNGTDGEYTFELKRALTNNDPNDAQFKMNAKNEITIAFWDPFQSVNGWTDDGHYTSSEYGTYFILGTLPSAPGYEVFVGILALLMAIPIFSRKRK